MEQRIIEELQKLGAMYTALIAVSEIGFFPGLRTLCEMNSCGAFGTNWGCPPGCGTVDELSCKVREYPFGVVYQYVGALEDSFDYEGMVEGGKRFKRICRAIHKAVSQELDDYLLLSNEGCDQCRECTYPDAPCRFPELTHGALEGYGILVSELAGQAGIRYINGANTVTYFGGLAYHEKA